jgi:hypothetical protein
MLLFIGFSILLLSGLSLFGWRYFAPSGQHSGSGQGALSVAQLRAHLAVRTEAYGRHALRHSGTGSGAVAA